MRFHGISSPDINNGTGCRVTLWVAGCSHHCKGCQNQVTWDFNGGKVFTDTDKEELFERLSKPYIQGITFSGGDPLDSYHDIFDLAKEIKEKFPSKDIWLFTGYTIQQIKNSYRKYILDYIDVIVDGEYIEEQRDITLKFRGSKNQNIIYINRCS